MKNEAWNIVELPVLFSFFSLFVGLFTEIIHKKAEFKLKPDIKSMKMKKTLDNFHGYNRINS